MCAFLSHYQALEALLDVRRCYCVAIEGRMHSQSSYALSIAHLFACYLRYPLDATETVHLQFCSCIVGEFVD